MDARDTIVLVVVFWFGNLLNVKADNGGTHFQMDAKYSGAYCSNEIDVSDLARSDLHCVNLCSNKQDCKGFFYNAITKKCSTVKNVPKNINECQAEQGSVYYKKQECGDAPAVNNSILNSTTGDGTPGTVLTYTCQEGYYSLANKSTCTVICQTNGNWTDMDFECRRAHDCDDIGRTGNRSSGVFKIFPVGAHDPINIPCDFDDPDGPWTVIQRRVDGTVNFYRNYSEYQAGFGNLSGNFWLGLDTISSIALQDGKRYSLKVTLKDSVVGTKFANYSQFQVLNATTGYRLHVGGYTGDAGDSLSSHNSLPFSTYDRDMDTSHMNCAEVFGGGWWFHGCMSSNLNGLYGSSSYAKGIVWGTTTGYYRSATFASMKVQICQKGQYEF